MRRAKPSPYDCRAWLADARFHNYCVIDYGDQTDDIHLQYWIDAHSCLDRPNFVPTGAQSFWPMIMIESADD